MRKEVISGLTVISLAATAGSAAEVHRQMRVFDIGLLVEEPEVSGVLPGRPVLRSPSAGEEAGDSSPAPDGGEGAGPRLSADGIATVVREMIDPESWSNERNTIEAAGRRLAVVQTPDVLDRIGRFLSILEARAARLLTIDLALVPPEALEKAAQGALRANAPPWFDGGVFDQAVAAAGAAASVFSTAGRERVPMRLQPSSTSLWLADYEVNQTGVLPVVNPAVAARREGHFAEVSVYPAPGGGWFRVDLRLGLARARGVPERRRFAYGDLDLPREERIEVGTSMTIPEGMTAVVGHFSAPAGGAEPKGEEAGRAPSFAAILRVRGAPLAGPAPEAAGLPHELDAAIVLRDAPGFRLAGRSEEPAFPIHQDHGDAAGDPSGGMEPDILLETIASLFPGDPADAPGSRLHFTDGSIFLRGTAEEARRASERLEALALERGRPVAIDLWQGPVAKEELASAGAGALLDRSWIEKIATRPGVRARITGAKGRAISLASTAVRSYVADLQMVSGGTGFKTATAADPRIGVSGAGLLLDASCEPVAGTPWAQARVRGDLARPPVFGREARARASHEVEPERTGGKPAARPIGEWVTLDLPDEDVDLWEHLVTAPQGQPVLLNALPDPSAPGATRVLILTVTEFGLDGKPAQEGRL